MRHELYVFVLGEPLEEEEETPIKLWAAAVGKGGELRV